MVRIGIADDHELYRKVIEQVLSDGIADTARVEVQAANGLELLRHLRNNELEVVFLDLEMPVLDGFETLKRLQSKYPTVRVIIMSLSHDDFMLMQLIKQGARGFIMKDAEPEMIHAAVHSVMSTGYFLDDIVGSMVLKSLLKLDNFDSNFTSAELTAEEQTLLSALSGPASFAEIAQKTGISEAKIKAQYDSLKDKLVAGNRNGVRLHAMWNENSTDRQ